MKWFMLILLHFAVTKKWDFFFPQRFKVARFDIFWMKYFPVLVPKGLSVVKLPSILFYNVWAPSCLVLYIHRVKRSHSKYTVWQIWQFSAIALGDLIVLIASIFGVHWIKPVVYVFLRAGFICNSWGGNVLDVKAGSSRAYTAHHAWQEWTFGTKSGFPLLTFTVRHHRHTHQAWSGCWQDILLFPSCTHTDWLVCPSKCNPSLCHAFFSTVVNFVEFFSLPEEWSSCMLG